MMQESRDSAQDLLEPTSDSIRRVAFATFCGSEQGQPRFTGGEKDCQGQEKPKGVYSPIQPATLAKLLLAQASGCPLGFHGSL